MLKKRIIPLLNLYKNKLVKSSQFKNYRNVGNLINSIRVYNSQFADEIVLINIDPNKTAKEVFENKLEEISKVCFMPLTVGGGIKSFEDINFLIRNGADKVLINSIFFSDLDLIKKTVESFGSQSLIVCIDYKFINNKYVLFTNNGKDQQDRTIFQQIEICEKYKVGEILIQSIDRDGMMNGYDLNIVKEIDNKTNIPMIVAGGVGNYEHIKELFLKTNVSAAACGSFFNFTDSNPMRVKSYLSNYDIKFKKV